MFFTLKTMVSYRFSVQPIQPRLHILEGPVNLQGLQKTLTDLAHEGIMHAGCAVHQAGVQGIQGAQALCLHQ